MAPVRPAGHRPGGDHHCRAAMDHRHAGPDAADPAPGLAPGSPARLPHPGLRRAADTGDPAAGGRRGQQLHRQEAGELGRPGGQPHPGRALHLFQRQAGIRHAVLRKRQRVPHRGAGAVAAARRLDHRLRHRHARRRRHQLPRGRLPQRLRADHAQPHGRLLRDAAQERLHRTEDERGRRAQVRHLHGRRSAVKTRNSTR